MKFIPLVFIFQIAQFSQAQEINYAKLDSVCQATSKISVKDERVQKAIEIAYEQNRLLGSQQIDRNGGLTRIGFHEGEYEKKTEDRIYAWEHVSNYWRAISDIEPDKIIVTGRKNERGRFEILKRLNDLNNNVEQAYRLSNSELLTIGESLQRAAQIDSPWSAAFISYLFKQAGFSQQEFKFSEAHVDYIDQSFYTSMADQTGTNSQHIYRACDITKTPPRKGDLICYVRGNASLKNSFQKFYELIVARRSMTKKPSVNTHCDLVVEADNNGDSKLSSIGGNVIQSVTLRKMYLNRQKILNPNYISSYNSEKCSETEDNCLGNVNYQGWVVLLQYRN